MLKIHCSLFHLHHQGQGFYKSLVHMGIVVYNLNQGPRWLRMFSIFELCCCKNQSIVIANLSVYTVEI